MPIIAYSLAVLSGLLDVALRNVIKLTDIDKYLLAAGGHIIALPIYIASIYFVEGMPKIGSLFWWAVIGHVPLYVGINLLIIEAHRSSSLTLTMPYLALAPVYQLIFVAPIQWLFVGKGFPTLWGGLGVVIVVLGIYALNIDDAKRMSGEKIGYWEPFRRIKTIKGSRLMFYVGLLAGVSGFFDYLGVTNSNASFFLLVDHGIVGFIFAMLVLCNVNGICRQNSKANLQSKIVLYVLLAFAGLSAMTGLTMNLAFYWIPEISYVFAARLSATIFLGVILGIFFGFVKFSGGKYADELENMKWRVYGTIIMIVGMVIIVLRGT